MSDLWKDQKPERQSFLSPCSVTFGSHLWLIFFLRILWTHFSWQAIDQSEEQLGGQGSNFQETGEWFVAQRGDVEVKSISIMPPPQFLEVSNKLPWVHNSQWISFDDWACTCVLWIFVLQISTMDTWKLQKLQTNTQFNSSSFLWTKQLCTPEIWVYASWRSLSWILTR